MSNEDDNWISAYLLENHVVDETDANIITQLLTDSRQSTQAIADAVGIKRPTAHERLKKLKEKGIIDSYTVKLNYIACGLPLRVFILASFDPSNAKEMTQKHIAKLLSKIKYVVQVDIITGSHDFLIQIAIDYMNNLADVIIEEMRAIPGVGNTQTLISFKNYKNGYETSKLLS